MQARQAVVWQSVLGAEDSLRRGLGPFNGPLAVRRWKRIPSVFQVHRVAVDAEVYSGKKVRPLSILLGMKVFEP